MEENTHTKLLCGLLNAGKLVPKLESMLRRLRAISILLMMRRDNTRSKIMHTVHSFHEQLAAFEKKALEEMEEVFNTKSEYLDMYRESVTSDIESLRSLSTEVESLLRYASGPSFKNHEVHAKRLIEVFSLVLNNNVVDLDVDDDVDCLDFVQDMKAEELQGLGKVVSYYPENSPPVDEFRSTNDDESSVLKNSDHLSTVKKSSVGSSDVSCKIERMAARNEQLPQRKFKLAGKKLKNLSDVKKPSEGPRDLVTSDEQDKERVELNQQTLTYSSVVKCDITQAISGISHNKDQGNSSEIEDSFLKPTMTSGPKESEQEVQYVSSEDRQRWKKSLDDMLTNVPQPTFKVATELLMNISKVGSQDSSDLSGHREEKDEQPQQQDTSKVDLTVSNDHMFKEPEGEIEKSRIPQVVYPEGDDQVVTNDLLWEEEKTEPDQVVPEPHLKIPDLESSPTDVVESSCAKNISPTNSGTMLNDSNKPEAVQERKVVPEIVSSCSFSSIREYIQKNYQNQGGVSVPAKLEVKLGHPGRGSGECLHFPIGVTTDLDGNILVTDTGNHLVKVFDKDGIFKYTIGDTMVPAFTRPSAIVVNKEGKIFVKDDVCIHKFTPSGRYLCRLGARKFNMPYGLALTSNGDLVTLDVCPGNSRVFIISPDGFYGTCYPFGPLINLNYESKCRFLTVHNDILYVSDLGCNCVYITDLFGCLLHTIGHSGHRLGLFSHAAGISVDKDGHIIVADSRNERIQIFMSNGRFLGVLSLSDPHIRPSDIHLTPDGRLIMVNFTNHEVRVYRLCVK
ncbi:tripartite motif-containing protein 2-like [Ylistrum balloti]|uniref:tripartite motif-containing protein 2-like n=1 Tax=Ylistrum balloti TaxID=509963 RepID=UPI002905D7A4|nr:tripartite motif-containing protein 2-like [Ylistrum balloti]